ncbi:hypothetical protein BUALT_Bualt16G0020300 [Buddleja alternifolia]|uniref:Bromodomain associated domain-containing protein n=1 Tax=Buddleja alternifolia TaxID=168488 RepID=A0AAV6WA39_9LAMI|nr:hypothetical protein BUALT_Bualt16G0020300 [Buddleja alternifolia]
MRKSLRQHQHEPPMDVDPDPDPNPPLSESEFSFAVARLAVAQICQTVGFNGGAQSRALEALTDIATRYLRAIAKLGAASANSHGRTESNLPDIIVALEELASVQGFVGSSSLRSHSTLYTSSALIKDLMKFVRYREEIPLAQPLPTRSSIVFGGAKGKFWRCTSDGDSMNRWYNDGEKSRRHVPRWLPDVPVVVVVTEEGKEKGRDERERIWGCLDDREEEENRVCCWERVEKEEENKEIEMLGKRRKVRFKMGVGVAAALGDHNMGEGMVRNLNLNLRCGGGGIGKRVVVCNGGGGGSGDENESKG